MKERILAHLHHFSVDEEAKEHFLFVDLCDELGLAESDLRRRCGEILFRILHNYSQFHVSTIDKFFHGLVRQFSEDLDLPENIRIEMDQRYLLRKAVEALFKRSAHEKALAQIINDFIAQKLEDGKSWNIESELIKFGSYLFKEVSIDSLDRLKRWDLNQMSNVQNHVRTELRTRRNKLEKYALDFISELRASGLELSDFPGKLSQGIGKFFNDILAGKIDFPTISTQGKFEAREFTNKSQSQAAKDLIESWEDRLSIFYTHYLNEITYITDLHVIARDLSPTFLLNSIAQELDKFKREEGVLHISEFNRKLAELVEAESIPYIYERSGEQFNHFLIDEFQDTSVVQWRNLIPLLENALSKSNRNMVVGDAKQAIYRFRNGDVMQFVRLPNLGAEMEFFQAPFKDEYKSIPLAENYRSKREVVEFNNRIFALLSQHLPEPFQKIYQGHEQEVVRSEGGMVQWKHLKNKDEIEEGNLRFISKAVRESLEDGFRPQDICILLRRKKEGRIIAEHMSAAGHELETEESLSVDTSASVHLMLSFLRFLLDPEDVYHHAEILHWAQAQTEDSIDPTRNLDLLSSDLQSWLQTMAGLGIPIEAAHFEGISNFSRCQRIVHLFGIDDREANVLEFLDFVLEHDRNNTWNLGELLTEYEERKSGLFIQNGHSAEAIRIMTIHKSKGLEFPVVIVPWCQWDDQIHREFRWHKPDVEGLEDVLFRLSLKNSSYSFLAEQAAEEALLDGINLLYVAFTRAGERLYIHSHPGNLGKLLSNVLQEIPEHQEGEDALELQLGTRTSWVPKESVESEMLELDTSFSRDWMQEFSFKLKEQNPLEVSWDKNPRAKGSALHQVLASLDSLEGFERHLELLAKQYTWTDEQTLWLHGAIHSLSREEDFLRFFEPGSHILVERDLIHDGELLRPDRVLIEGDKASILDFKTGEEKSSDYEQLERYKRAFQDLGFQKVTAEIYRFES